MVAFHKQLKAVVGDQSGSKAKLQGAARVIQQGGVWTQARLRERDGVEVPRCQWCGGPPETVMHRWWDCPAWSSTRRRLEEPPGPRNLLENIPSAILECGLPLKGSVPIPPLAAGRDQVHEPVTDAAMRVWTDGSCTHPKDSRLRRAGWGLWAGELHPWNVSSPLLGQEQTAFRAELRAMVAAVEMFAGELEIASDCEAVVKTANSMLSGHRLDVTMVQHSDLWSRFARVIQRRQGMITVRWIRSHRAEQGATDEDALGNQGADRLAAEGAKQHEVPDEVVKQILELDAWFEWVIKLQVEILNQALGRRGNGPKNWKVRKRRRKQKQESERAHQDEHEEMRDDVPPQSEVQADCTQEPEGRRRRRCRGKAVRREPGLGALAGENDHKLQWLGQRVVCSKCGRAVNQKIKARLRGSCAGAPKGARERRNLLMLGGQSGGGVEERSHEVLIVNDGRIACRLCGRCVQPRLMSRLASAQCAEPTTALNRAWVQRLADRHGVSWRQFEGAGNLAKGLHAKLKEALAGPVPAADPVGLPRRRITGKRPAPL